MKLFYTDAFVLPLPAGHHFPMEKYSVLSKRIADAAGDTAEELRIAAEMGIHADSKEDLHTVLELAAEEVKKGYEKIKKII